MEYAAEAAVAEAVVASDKTMNGCYRSTRPCYVGKGQYKLRLTIAIVQIYVFKTEMANSTRKERRLMIGLRQEAALLLMRRSIRSTNAVLK